MAERAAQRRAKPESGIRGLILPHRGVMPKIHDSAFIAETAVVIGDVEIGPDCGIWYGCVLRGDDNEIRVGARVNLQDGTIVHVNSDGSGTYIGDDVSVGHMALLHACTVESGGFVGMRACVLDDAHVESGAMVAAGAVVTPGKRVKAGEIWAGNPARPMRDIRPDERVRLNWIGEHYVGLAARYRDQNG